MKELQEMKDESLRLRKQMEDRRSSFEREKEQAHRERQHLEAEIDELRQDHHETSATKETLGREKEWQAQETDRMERRLLEVKFEKRRLQDELSKREDAVQQGQSDAEALGAVEQATRILKERLEQEA